MLVGKLVVFLGFAAVMAFLVIMLAAQNSLETRLDCDRAAGLCTFTERHMMRTSRTSLSIQGLGPPSVRVSTGRRSSVISVWLATPTGDAYFDDYLTRREAQEDADRIDRFLKTPSDLRLTIIRDHRKIYGLAWVLAAVSSALLLFLGWVLFLRKEPSPRSA
jgi:hypothetical protein